MAMGLRLSKERAEQIVRSIYPCIDQVDQDLAEFNDQILEGRELFNPRPEPEDLPWEGASTVHVPLCEINRMQLRARIDKVLLCATPIVRFEAYKEELRTAARNVEALVNYVMRDDMDFRKNFIGAIDAALTDGAAAIYITGKREYLRVKRWNVEPVVEAGYPTLVPHYYVRDEMGNLQEVPEEEVGNYNPDELLHASRIDPETGEPDIDWFTEYSTRHRLSSRRELVYDGPTIRVLENGPLPFDSSKSRWGTFPSTNADIQQSTGVFIRYSLTGNELLQRANDGIFDLEAVEELRHWDGDIEALPTSVDEFQSRQASLGPKLDFPWRPFDLIEMYWRIIPDEEEAEQAETEEVGEDGRLKGKRKKPVVAEDWLFVIHEPTLKVLQAEPNPWAHGKRPIVPVIPFRQRFGIIGTSIPDISGDMQQTMTDALRDSFNLGRKQMRPPKVIRRGLLEGREIAEYLKEDRPGGGWEADNPEAITERIPQGSPSAMIPILQQARLFDQQNSGVSEEIAGTVKSGATATAVEIAQAQGTALFSHMIENVAESISEAAWFIQQYLYQFVDTGWVQQRWALVTREGEAQPMPGVYPGQQELSIAYRINAWGASEAANQLTKDRRAPAFMELMALPELQVLPGDSEQAVREKASRQYTCHRAYITNRDLGDPVELIGTEEEHVQNVLENWQKQQQIQQQMEAAAGAAMPQVPGENSPGLGGTTRKLETQQQLLQGSSTPGAANAIAQARQLTAAA
jgi:hypothetical protein